MIHLALLADAALLLVILRMVWVGADRACPREFFFLLSLLCYALLSFAPSFPAWAHASLAFFAAPMLFDATKNFPARRAVKVTFCICVAFAAAASVSVASVARWGNSEAASWALLGSLLALAGGIVLLASTLRLWNSATRELCNSRALRAAIGLHLVVVYASAFAGVPFALTVLFAAAIWTALAWLIAPTPDALVNPEKLVGSRQFSVASVQAIARKGRTA